MKVAAVFTLGTGRTLTLPVGEELALVSLGEVGLGDRVILSDLTIISVAYGVWFGDDDDPHTDPPDGDWTSPVTLKGLDGTVRHLPRQTRVWRLRNGGGS